MKKILLIFMFIPVICAMQSSFDEGKNTAEFMKNGIENNIKSGSKKTEVPQYKDGVVISKDELSRAFEHLRNSEYGKDIVEIHQTRKPYILDDTEPFMVRSENAHQHPEKAFEQTEEIQEDKDFTIETCEECPQEEFFVKARKIKKRYVYLDKPPYIETSGGRCNHGFFQVKITIPVEPEEAFFRKRGMEYKVYWKNRNRNRYL